jgi:glyceraldehyde 3-phosphate dehydrogenase
MPPRRWTRRLPPKTLLDQGAPIMTVRLGINGFGRIGRTVLRAALERQVDMEIVGLNDIADVGTLAHLLRFDSVHGKLPYDVAVSDQGIEVDGRTIAVSSEKDPAALPWKDLGADIVVESTGLFTQRETAAKHLQAGAKKVIVSAPAKGADLTIVLGVNSSDYDSDAHDVVSNASCTTNCVAPMAKVLDDAFGLEHGFMTTCHAYTADQQLQDGPHKDLRRARAGALNVVPTSTGAARAVGLVLPRLEGKLDGLALRVPVSDGSITDLNATVSREVTAEEVNDAFRSAAAGSLAGYLEYSEDPLVSSDVVGNPRSCVFDSGQTMVDGRSVKILGWYDNEWGYANRCVDLAAHVGARL